MTWLVYNISAYLLWEDGNDYNNQKASDKLAPRGFEARIIGTYYVMEKSGKEVGERKSKRE